ncbi:Variant-specific surface protein, partial [Giardia duodenalis]
VMATVTGTGDVRGAVLEMPQRPFSPWSLETPHTGEAARTPEIRYTGACLWGAHYPHSPRGSVAWCCVLYGLPAMFEKIIFGIAILQVVWAATTCTEATSDSQSGKCKQNMCNVWIGGSNFCSQCSTAAEHLVNGKCITTGEDAEGACTAKNDGTCTSCKAGFFLHRGGCYKIGTEPGNLICKDTQASQTQGVCKACSPGYFKNPTEPLDKTKESCIACNQTTAIDENKGVQNCATCTIENPAGALRLGKTATCKTCFEGFFVASGGTACTACNDDNCATCVGAGAGKCTRCKLKSAGGNDKEYLKVTDASSNSGECVNTAGCTGTHFPAENVGNQKQCISCGLAAHGGIDGCAECAPVQAAASTKTPAVTCTACAEGKKPNSAGTKCVSCPTKDCAKCTDDGICAECGSGKKLSPKKDLCLDACPAGTRTDANVCSLCHESCAECSGDAGATSCTACYPGYVLIYENNNAKGKCIPECTGDFMAHCAAGQCDGVIGGSKYCKKCEDGYVPINGICTAVGAAARDASMCTAGDGICTGCKGDYALLSGGCYGTKQLPGRLVCTATTDGSCTTCANGQNQNGGKCPECPANCEKCSGPNTCTKCLPGYYKGANSNCFKCTENDSNNGNGVTGIADCISCAPPTGGSGPVTCYVTQQKTDDGTGGDTGGDSTNKSGLSTGAIAGISVAVVVVVGGLVGFLCWWFICRGKA